MKLLGKLLPRKMCFQVRPPDHVEARDGLFLQIWGDEGYWQVVDEEFRHLLSAAERPTSLQSILDEHPEWKRHKRSIAAQLASLTNAGITGTPTPPAPAIRIENVTINLTTGCNLSCRTCYVPQETRTHTKLDSCRALKFLNRLRPSLGREATISLLGGEPFLHAEGVLEVGRWAKRHGYFASVSTNGTFLPERIVAGLANVGLQVQVSLDGATEAVNDRIRGAGTFMKATASIRSLTSAGVPVVLCMVCCRENIAEIPNYFRLAVDLGAKRVRFIPLKKLGNAQVTGITPAPQLEIVKAICRELDANLSYATMCESDLYSVIRSMLRESSRRQSCGSGTHTLLVQPDGSVYPCINSTKPLARLGHIDDDVPSLLARGKRFGNTLVVDSPKHPCRECHVKRWCLAGCPGETLQGEGALTRRHWSCDDLRETILFVMWRLAKEGALVQGKVTRACM